MAEFGFGAIRSAGAAPVVAGLGSGAIRCWFVGAPGPTGARSGAPAGVFCAYDVPIAASKAAMERSDFMCSSLFIALHPYIQRLFFQEVHGVRVVFAAGLPSLARVLKSQAHGLQTSGRQARIEMPATQIEKNPRVASAMTDVAIHPM